MAARSEAEANRFFIWLLKPRLEDLGSLPSGNTVHNSHSTPSPFPLYIRNHGIGIVLDSYGGWQPDYPEGIKSPWESCMAPPLFFYQPEQLLGPC